MRRYILLALAVAIWSPSVSAESSVRVSVGTTPLQLDFLYRDYGVVERADIDPWVEDLGETDFMVALHLARVAGVNVSVVIEQRRAGLSWDTITRRCHCDSRVYSKGRPMACSSGETPWRP